jgi:parallel beta-helix repeat protein
MTSYKLFKLGAFCFLLIGYTGKLFSKEYWLFPPSQSSETCTKYSCLCNKGNACVLNDLLLKKIKAGDSLYFKKGTYPALLIRNIHGTAEHPITFNGYFGVDRAEISLNPRGYRDLIEIRKSSHLIFSGFNINNSQRAGIRVNNSHYVILKNNKLTNNGVWGIFTNHSNYFTATNNKILGPAEQHGIYHSNSGDNVKITSNIIQNFNGCGVHMNGDLSMGGGEKVKGDGIISNVEITNNYFSGNGLVGGSAINLDGVVGGNINDNIAINNKAAGISIFKDDGAVGSSNISVSNNLIIMAKGSKWAVNIKNSGGNNNFTNNIIISQNSFRGIYDVLPVDLRSNDKDMPFSATKNSYGYARNLIALNDQYYLPLSNWQKSYKSDIGSSKISYKHVISDTGKIIQPLVELVKQKRIAEFNPNLFLLY